MAEGKSQSFIVKPSKLNGIVSVSGAKNSALPIIAASLLVNGEVTIKNVPNISDVRMQMKILRLLGAKIKILRSGDLCIDSTNCTCNEVPYELAKMSRGSILFMSSLIARFREIKLGLAGGDDIGARPINFHLEGLKAMGANVTTKEKSVEMDATVTIKQKLKGAHIFLDRPSTTATENIMIAATLAEGTTIIENAEKVADIVDLAKFLRGAGAKIKGEGTGIITIKGVKELTSTSHRLIPDPFEAGTYMVASAITKGDVFVRNAISNHLVPTIAKLREAGVKMEIKNGGIRVIGGIVKPLNIYVSAPYPAFQSDMQPIFAALLALSKGKSTIVDSVFPQRFKYVNELRKMNAQIDVEANTALIKGVEKLTGAHVKAEDIRGGASLVLAALAAESESVVDDIHHIDRAYEKLEKKLNQLGAEIKRQ